MRTRTAALILALLLGAGQAARADRLVLVAGGGSKTENVAATEAKMNDPFGIAFDARGNAFLVELLGGRVLKIDPKGILTVAAGAGTKGDAGDGGPPREARFNGLHSLVVGPDDTVYLADTWNNRIRTLDPKTGRLAAFAGTGKKGYAGDGGPARTAQFFGIHCIALDPLGKTLYLADLSNRRVRAINLKTGVVSLIAGNGKRGVPKDGAVAKDAPLVDPRAVAVDRKGNVYILERSGHALRVVDAQGKIRTVAGTGKAGNSGDGGPARMATLNGPKHLCIDDSDRVIIADSANHVIRRYDPANGTIVRLAGTGKKGRSGSGGEPLRVSLNEPHGVTVTRGGTLYVVDSLNGRVFRWEK